MAETLLRTQIQKTIGVKKIVFITGTRAEWGKIKTLVIKCSELYEVFIYVTGMHMGSRYGSTIDEIKKGGHKNIFPFYNHYAHDSMDTILAKTIDGFSSYVKDINPDLVIALGDRCETLASAIVCGMNNILFAHFEGGESSGTIDNSIRFSISKLAHVHMVTNEKAKKRLLQMGESEDSIYVIGSPSLDIILSDNLPTFSFVREYYDIKFTSYAILIFHPVTTEFDSMHEQAKAVVNAVLNSCINYIVILPNNDTGCDFILSEFKRLEGNPNIRIFPSIRFEYFLTLLKNANMIVGNSSSGIMEAPYYNIPTINIGTRQQGRVNSDQIINCQAKSSEITIAIGIALKTKIEGEQNFGKGNSAELFVEILKGDKIWNTSKQKHFIDL